MVDLNSSREDSEECEAIVLNNCGYIENIQKYVYESEYVYFRVQSKAAYSNFIKYSCSRRYKDYSSKIMSNTL